MLNTSALLCFLAAIFAVILGGAAVVRRRKSLASWSFCVGMLVLAAESVCGGMSLQTGEPAGGSAAWREAALRMQALIPGFWLVFSLRFSRGNSREFLHRWRFGLAAAFLVPAGLVMLFRGSFYQIGRAEGAETLLIAPGPAAKALTALFLLSTIVILTNVEKTFRATVGTTRWRVKFMILGLGVLFGTRIYTLSQTLLFPTYHPTMTSVDAGALLLACGLMTVGYLRSGFSELEVYPSREILEKSVTVTIAGAYLLLVGVLSEMVAYLGGPAAFPAQAFIVLLGIAGLAVLLLSDRFRMAMQQFVSRNFKRPEHDFRRVWSRFSRGLSGVVGADALCTTASKLIAETYDVLSTTFLLLDRHREQFVLASSTSRTGESRMDTELDFPISAQITAALREQEHPFDLEKPADSWAEALRAITPVQFSHGGNRLAVRLMAGERLLGLLILSDRVNGVPYTHEELDLLECIAEELAARLLNQNLGEQLMQAREMEAFQAMSAFFVHDMKNAASGLNLTLKNLPKHYDNPQFREDALRGLARTADRICQLTERLGALRQNLQPAPVKSDLNQIIRAALADLGKSAAPDFELTTELPPLPMVEVDADQIRSVVTNLVLNAREAMPAGGKVRVTTRNDGSRVLLTVEDNGCGMSEAFIRNSLFRPFQSTKKQGLGIGMFQARMIVEAHHGTLQVASEPQQGTTFRIHLPVAQESS